MAGCGAELVAGQSMLWWRGAELVAAYASSGLEEKGQDHELEERGERH